MLSKRCVRFSILLSMLWQVQCIPNICKKLDENRKKACERIYVWNKEQKAFVSFTNASFKGFTYKDYRKIHHKTVKVVTTNMLPYVISSNASTKLDGFLGDVWNIIHEKYKFNYVVSSLGYEAGLKMISSGKADVMLGAVVYKKDLMNVYYSHPYFYNWYHLYLKKPKGHPSSALYLKIFSPLLWFSALSIFILLTVSVWLTSRFLRGERQVSVPSSALGVISGFINQGFDLKLRSYSGRLQVMLALVFGLMLYYSMNAVLVARIAVFEAPYPFTSLEDIATRSQLSLCVRTESFVYNNFTDENKIVLPKWRNTLNNKNCLDIVDAQNIPKIICNDNVIILENQVVMNSLLKNTDLGCAIHKHDKKYFITGNSYLMAKSFKEKRVIDNYIHHMRSMGIIQRLGIKWTEGTNLEETSISSSQVTMEHTKGVFTCYIFSIILSLIILGLEIIYNKYVSTENVTTTGIPYCN